MSTTTDTRVVGIDDETTEHTHPHAGVARFAAMGEERDADTVADKSAQARAAWLAGAREGRPPSGAELARRFAMSERWGRDRAAEARATHPHLAASPGGTPRPPRAARALHAATTGTSMPSTAVSEPGGTDPARPAPLGTPAHAPAPTPDAGHNGASASGLPLDSPPRGPQADAAAPRTGDTGRALASLPPTAAAVVPVAGDRPASTVPPVPPPIPMPVPVPVVVTARQRRRSAVAAAAAMTPGLSISWWSFMVYLQAGGAPWWLAAVASASVDGIAVYSSLYAAWFTDHGRPARLAKAATYSMVLASALVNWMHATSMHWSIGLHVVLSVPSIGAAVALELALQRMRVVARARREQRRHTRQAAKVDADLWIQHPIRVWRYRRAEGLRRLADVFDD